MNETWTIPLFLLEIALLIVGRMIYRGVIGPPVEKALPRSPPTPEDQRAEHWHALAKRYDLVSYGLGRRLRFLRRGTPVRIVPPVAHPGDPVLLQWKPASGDPSASEVATRVAAAETRCRVAPSTRSDLLELHLPSTAGAEEILGTCAEIDAAVIELSKASPYR